ncbi:hypothetical protein HMPREF9289_1500 [Finegoldia magna BVS033A4]|uniref:Uncharacterized protein n=1 Tax=Finegoldia magna BVS033A4 TaxID=866773 RepID=E1KZK8_FINMA|nr:hypothetical protein HMPREF9289_1500 [Finegoldia magna BVS033A4]
MNLKQFFPNDSLFYDVFGFEKFTRFSAKSSMGEGRRSHL